VIYCPSGAQWSCIGGEGFYSGKFGFSKVSLSVDFYTFSSILRHCSLTFDEEISTYVQEKQMQWFNWLGFRQRVCYQMP
jgi:hypothetical protein